MSGNSRQLTLRSGVRSSMRAASLLSGKRPMMWMMPLHLHINQQEGQVALNHSPEFCLKLTYRNLLKADHVPGDTLGKPFLAPRALFEQT